MSDIRTYGAVPDGTTDSTTAIQNAVDAGDVTITDGVFLISSSIKIPSNRNVYIKNAKIRLASASYDNVFINKNPDIGNVNITILGFGNACIDGNSAGNNDPDYSEYSGRFSLYWYKSTLICFSGVDNLRIEGLNLVDRVSFCFSLIKCTNVTLGNHYSNAYNVTQNQDLLNIGTGCNNLHAFNIWGYAFDDIFACYAGKIQNLSYPISGWRYGDIHDIEINDFHIYGAYYGSMLAIICGDGNKTYNINSHDNLINCGTVFFTSYGNDYYDTLPAKTDIHDIVMTDITVDTNMRDYLIYFGLNMQDIDFTGIVNNTAKPLNISDGGDQDDVWINGTEIFA